MSSINTGIEWTDKTWNPTTGCTKVSPGCTHCLAPETLVLYADFTWRRLGDVKVGDVLVGFDENVTNPTGRGMRMLRRSEVKAVWRSVKEAMRVTTDQTEVICSKEHRFLSAVSNHWIYAGNFTLGTQIRSIGCRPYTSMNYDYAAGYLMGMTDGDGTWRFTPGQRSDKLGYPQCYWRVALADEEALLATQSHLFAFGLTAEIKPFHVNNGRGYYKPMQRLEIRSIPVLTVLDNILNYRETADYGSGYLAGIFDAEGSFNQANLRISNKNQSYIDRVIEYGKLLNLDFRAESPRPNGVTNARLYGNRRDRIAFFTLTQPAIRRKAEALFDTSIDTEPATVVRLESLGEHELIDIETTTHTFFANGLTTHNCYAEALTKRFPANFPQGFKLTVHEERLQQPLKWRSPSRIFVNSMSDLFHEEVEIEFLQKVFDIIRQTPHHIYQVLTKRHERLLELAEELTWYDNIWLGVSVESQEYVKRVDYLRKIKAKVKFLSCEPLLGNLELDLTGIDWVIVGGESGQKHRPIEISWVEDIRDQCQAEKVAFFFKQVGGRTPKAGGRLLDNQIWDEMPSAWYHHVAKWGTLPHKATKFSGQLELTV